MQRDKNTFTQSPEEAMRAFRANNDIRMLATKTGASNNVLLDQLNPDREHKYGYLQAIAHSHLTGDVSLLKAWAADVGLGVFELPKNTTGDEEMLDLILMLQQSTGFFAQSFYKAREDGIIEEHEAKELLTLISDKVSLLTKLGEEIKTQVRSLDPKLHSIG